MNLLAQTIQTLLESLIDEARGVCPTCNQKLQHCYLPRNKQDPNAEERENLLSALRGDLKDYDCWLIINDFSQILCPKETPKNLRSVAIRSIALGANRNWNYSIENKGVHPLILRGISHYLSLNGFPPKGLEIQSD